LRRVAGASGVGADVLSGVHRVEAEIRLLGVAPGEAAPLTGIRGHVVGIWVRILLRALAGMESEEKREINVFSQNQHVFYHYFEKKIICNLIKMKYIFDTHLRWIIRIGHSCLCVFFKLEKCFLKEFSVQLAAICASSENKQENFLYQKETSLESEVIVLFLDVIVVT